MLKSVAAGQVIDAPLGPSHSSVTTDAGKVVSTATTEGATINLLSVAPLPADNATGAAAAAPATPALKPLLTLTLGSARATATYDRHTGKSSGTFDPASDGVPGMVLFRPVLEITAVRWIEHRLETVRLERFQRIGELVNRIVGPRPAAVTSLIVRGQQVSLECLFGD